MTDKVITEASQQDVRGPSMSNEKLSIRIRCPYASSAPKFSTTIRLITRYNYVAKCTASRSHTHLLAIFCDLGTKDGSESARRGAPPLSRMDLLQR